jgi:hypothetical protein
MTVGDDATGTGVDYAADDADQRSFARTIGSEQSEYLAALNLQVYIF